MEVHMFTATSSQSMCAWWGEMAQEETVWVKVGRTINLSAGLIAPTSKVLSTADGFPPQRSSLWGCCRTWENELCMKTFPCYPLVVLMPQIMFLLREPNMRHVEKIILYISFKKIKKLQHNLFHFHPFPHCLSYIYPPSQSPPVSFGFNGGHSPVWNFSPQTQTDKFKQPICGHLRGLWEENDSQMSRRP